MKLMVDVKQAIQEYDLDSGTTKNYLVFSLGGVEQRVEASEEQLQQAIVDAQTAGHSGGRIAHVHDFYRDREPKGQLGDIYEDEPEEEPINIEDLAQSLLAEGHDDADVAAILQESFPEEFALAQAPSTEDIAPTLFEDFSGQATEEEMAEFSTDGADVLPDSINIMSDDMSGGGKLAAIITGSEADRGVTRTHPITGKKRKLSAAQAHRVDQIRSKPHLQHSKRDAMAMLRDKALRTPSRSVQADSAGNPIAPQTNQPMAPTTQETHIATLPGFDDDGFSPG